MFFSPSPFLKAIEQNGPGRERVPPSTTEDASPSFWTCPSLPSVTGVGVGPTPVPAGVRPGMLGPSPSGRRVSPPLSPHHLLGKGGFVCRAWANGIEVAATVGWLPPANGRHARKHRQEKEKEGMDDGAGEWERSGEEKPGWRMKRERGRCGRGARGEGERRGGEDGGSVVREAGDGGGERERDAGERDAESNCVVGEWCCGRGGPGSAPLGGGSCGSAKCPANAHGHTGEGLPVLRILWAGQLLLGAAGTRQSLLAGKMLRNRGGC